MKGAILGVIQNMNHIKMSLLQEEKLKDIRSRRSSRQRRQDFNETAEVEALLNREQSSDQLRLDPSHD